MSGFAGPDWVEGSVAGTIPCWLDGDAVLDVEIVLAVYDEDAVGSQVVYDEESPGGIENNLMWICAPKSVTEYEIMESAR